MMNNENNWNLLEKVTDEKPHIYDAKTDNELIYPEYLNMNLRHAYEELDIVIRDLSDVATELINNNAFMRSEVGGFNLELSEMIWMLLRLHTLLYSKHDRNWYDPVDDGLRRRGLIKEGLNSKFGYIDTDNPEETAHDEDK